MHIVITGASSGIGAALARELATLPGAKLTLIARRVEKLEELAASLSVPAHLVQKDLSVVEGAESWIEEAVRTNGPIEVLIHNAGVQVVGPTAGADVEAGEASLRLNLLVPLRLSAAILPSMIERGRGHVVNIASMAALAPTAGMTYYNASKGGLAGASEAMYGELRGQGVHVMTVYPGIVAETDMAQQTLGLYEPSIMLRLQPTGTAAGLAKLIRKGLRSRTPRVVYPRLYGLTRWFLPIVRWFMNVFTPPLREPESGAAEG